jgi:hypothetical protein
MQNRGPVPDRPIGCPVDRESRKWLERAVYWMGSQFGTEVCYRDPVLPVAGFLSAASYCASPEGIEALVTRLCELMLIERDRVRLELFDGSEDKRDRRAVGHFRVSGGKAVIALDESEASDPGVLTAIAVHELCHERLLGERRIERGRADGERLTDLLTVYFGSGIFSANAAMRFTRANRGWTIIPSGVFEDRELNAASRLEGYRRLGYLKSAEFGYALACYSWLRREQTPTWAKYLNPGPRAFMTQGLAYLARVATAGRLPTESA